MDSLVILLRIVHIVPAVFWAGTMLFVTLFLEPSIRATGPDGAKVMRQLAARRFFTVMPIVALVTILSGTSLLWIVSGGFQPAWMGSATGATLSLGTAAAVAAFLVGVLVMRPATMKLFALGEAAAQAAGGPQQAAIAQQMLALRARAAAAGRVVSALLAVAAIAMAAGRYL